MGLTDTAISGPLWLALPLAVSAGAVSFASPCVVPLVPGYLAYLAGLVGADAADAVPVPPPVRAVSKPVEAAPTPDRGPSTPTAASGPSAGASTDAATAPVIEPRTGELASAPGHSPARGGLAAMRTRVVGAAALFVAGFTAVFVVGLGAVVWLADALLADEELLQRIGGVVTVAMGLVFIGLVPALQRDTRPHWVPRAGVLGAPLLGATFGLGWTPCLGPTLTGVVALAAGSGTLRGLILILAYCAGLGMPFVVLASGTQRGVRWQGWLRRHTRTIQLTGGALLILVGLALASGLWAHLVTVLRAPIAGYSTPL